MRINCLVVNRWGFFGFLLKLTRNYKAKQVQWNTLARKRMIINIYTIKLHIILWPQSSFVLEVSIAAFFISNYISKTMRYDAVFQQQQKRYNGIWKIDLLSPYQHYQVHIHCLWNPFLHQFYVFFMSLRNVCNG